MSKVKTSVNCSFYTFENSLITHIHVHIQVNKMHPSGKMLSDGTSQVSGIFSLYILLSKSL